MKKKNRFIFTKKFYIILTTSLLAITALIIALGGLFDKKDSSNFMAYTNYYQSPQYEIGSISDASDVNVITMTQAASLETVDSKYTITISSAQELYLFSTTCNDKSAFAGYKYKLTGNIDYNTTAFEPIESFSGTFDGMGYEINNLSITSSSSSGYVSMFAVNNGTISNFGLVNPTIRITATEGYVAPICGLNKKEISYVFVRDLRNPQEDAAAGLLTNGYFIVAGLVYENAQGATLHDSYTAYEIVVNREAVDYVNQFSEVLTNNNGTINNLYFYHGSIEAYTSAVSSESGKIEIKYDSGTINKEYELENHFGTYCESKEVLNTNVTTNDSQGKWFVASDYGALASYLSGIETPVSRGMVVKGKTFTISDEADYSYMYELMNLNDYFASKDITYEIANNINLALIPKENYYYKRIIDATIKGVVIENPIALKENDSAINNYPTIFNGSIDKASTEGIDTYGLFSYVSGTIENLNIANMSFNIESSDNIIALGSAVGYLYGGTLRNVNVYGNYSFASNIGKFYVGQTIGLAAGNATISNVTAAGSITNTSAASAGKDVNEYMNGSAIGGIAGYSASTLSSFNDCLSSVNITSQTFSSNSSNIAIGGILGAGYTDISKNLENRGTISVSGNSSNLYVAGIIGRHLGLKTQSSYFNNAGDISVTLGSQEYAFVSGVVNADIQTTATADLATSSLRENGRYQYQGAAFTNGANISIVNAPANNLEYTNVLNINSSNGFESRISGIYNLQYRTSGSSSKLNNQSIDMSKINEFAPVVNVNSSTTQTKSQTVNASTVYNLRSIDYTSTSNIIVDELKFSGCMLGEYINYTNVRNEGNMTFDISNTIESNTFKVFGVFEELQSGYFATAIYNGGDIDLNLKNTITGDVNFSGICYANKKNSLIDINKYNPALSTFDKNATGSMNNVINNGIISVKSDEYSNITYSTETILSANGQSNLGNEVNTEFTNNDVRIVGDLYLSGITTINESVITNTFNLGDIIAANYILDTNNVNQVNAAGISILNIGLNAYILNSANSGNIKAINLSSNEGETVYLSDVNAAGITCRNDLNEDGNDYSGNNSNANSDQIISFTINYGEIYSYNYRDNITSSAEEPHAKSAGILAMGLCNVINVLNYGNIYGSETSSGIFGIVYFRKFQSEVTSDVNIANTINYGNVYMLDRGYNYIHDSISNNVSTNTNSTMPDAKCVSYSTFMNFNQNNVESYARTSIARNTQYISVIGSIFSIVNFNLSSNANNVKIRYLISFNDAVSIVGYATAVPTNVNVDVSSFYSAYYKINAKTGAYQLDEWMGKYVTYIPLITGEMTTNVVTTINVDDSVDTEYKTYNGAFSENFEFRLAIDGDESYLDEANYPTDKFISDYFQFVGYKYVNDHLLDKIGWRSIAYITAANDFGKNIEAILKIFDKTTYSNFIDSALSTENWMVYASNEAMIKIIEELFEQCDVEALKDMLEYVFSDDSKSGVVVNEELRENIYDIIVKNKDNIDYNLLLSSILNYQNGYSEILSEVILNNSDEVADYINNYISNVDDATLEELLGAYLNYLNANGDNYFNLIQNETERYTILNTLFENIDDEDFYNLLLDILDADENSSLSDTASMYQGYLTLNANSKKALYDAIIANNSYSKLDTYLSIMESEIGYYSQLVEYGYNNTSMDQIVSGADLISNSTSTSSTVIDNRIELWNQIKDTTIFTHYLEGLYSQGIYKATEYNNTYQSITEPHNDGAYVGDTLTERLGYYYTTSVTPQTYFYGPYKNDDKENNQHYNSYNQNVNDFNSGYTSLFHYSDNTLWSSNEIMKSRGGDNSTTTYAQYLNDNMIIMYYDYANEQLGEANKNVTLHNITFKGFETDLVQSSKTLADPMNNIVYNTSDWTGVEFTKNNWTMTVTDTGETFSLSDGAITGIYYAGRGSRTLANGNVVTVPNIRTYIKDSNGTYHPVYGSYTITDGTNTYTSTWPSNAGNELYNQYSFIIHLAGKKYYTSSAVSNTGIFRRAEPWNSSQYFTWKQSNNQKVYTSQYIDYSASDILNLDGYLTEYTESVVQSLDERDIINSIFNDYLCKSANINNFKKVIKAALLEALGNNIDNGNSFIDQFIISNIYSNSTVENNQPFEYLNYTNNQTVATYLKGLFSSDSSAKNKLILAAVSNKTTYINLINELMKVDVNITATEAATYINYYNSIIYVMENNIVGSSATGEYDVISKLASDIGMDDDLLITTSDINGTGLKYSDTTQGSYNYGVKFNTINLSLSNNVKSVKFMAEGVNGASTLSILDGSTTTNITINAYGEYTYTPNSTSLVISSNSDVILYDVIEVITESQTETKTYSSTIDNEATSGTLVSKDTLVSDIEDSINNSNMIEGTLNISLNTVSAKATIYVNRNTNYSYILRFVGPTNSGQTSSEISGSSSGDVTINIYDETTNLDDLSGTWNVYRNETGTTNSYIYATNIDYDSNYTYTYDYTNDLLSLGNFTVTTPRAITEDDKQNLITNYISGQLNSVSDTVYTNSIDKILINLLPLDHGSNISWYDELTSTQIEEFVKLLVVNYNLNLNVFINTVCTDKELLMYVFDVIYEDSNNYHYLSDIIKNGNDNNKLNDSIKEIITAAYITADYINILNQSQSNQSIKVYNTELRQLLSQLDSKYQYINSNGSFDNDKFDDLLEYLGYDMSTSGYGIYALSSSKGILNGEFIPDNIVLDDLDSGYTLNNDYYVLSNDSSSNWRGGSDSNENDTTNTESVNYAVLVEMKQLKKSIGTTIFELNLIDNNGITHYSSESSIDLENGIITYYVPNGYFDSVSTQLTIEESTISVSNLASICMSGKTTDLRNDTATDTVTLTNLTSENIIRVYAEDTTVFKDYTIEFVEMDIAFDLVYSSVTNGTMNSTTSANVDYKDGVVVLSLTSDTLPEKLDLTPYIDICLNGTPVTRETAFKLSNEETDHIINNDHDSTITMDILSSLKTGTYTIVVNIFGVSKSVTLIKDPSTEHEILEFEYEGIDIAASLVENGSYTSYIDFGRAFNYEELSDNTSDTFYLNRFSISENATCNITVEKAAAEEGLLTYTVKYLITAEDTSSSTYIHYLVEKHPFKNYGESGALTTAFNFASYYLDGDLEGTKSYSTTADNTITVEFDRGSEPQYRIKYTLSNFYTLGDNVTFDVNANAAVGATYVNSYAGITATVTEACEAGTYRFIYSYSNTGTWSDGNYERVYEFPAFVIIKNYSKDATLNNITYIDGMSMLSSTSTAISATHVLRPTDEGIDTSTEIDYETYSKLDSTAKPIEAEGIMINYANIEEGTDYSDSSYKDYYLIGSLSNAKLAYYAPIFKIEEHAEIYQYTTRYKLDNYGEGLQNKDENNIISDKDILTNHETTYIYVPYTADGTTIEVFLVQVSNTNQWTNVYTIESNATGDPITTLEENKGSFTYNEKTYEVHESAGTPTNNTSLYMDYIGTPLEDHFWYVSYVVFSENALKTTDSTHIKYFHVSLIDLTNNIYFEIQVNAPTDFALESIYITFAAEHVATAIENEYTSKQLSAYVENTETTTEDGNYNIYLINSNYELQIMPSGYYYFYLDLPNGYKVSYEITNDKENRNEEDSGYPGAYLPPSSIVTQRICITFTIAADTETADIWGVSTSDIYSRQASVKQ